MFNAVARAEPPNRRRQVLSFCASQGVVLLVGTLLWYGSATAREAVVEAPVMIGAPVELVAPKPAPAAPAGAKEPSRKAASRLKAAVPPPEATLAAPEVPPEVVPPQDVPLQDSPQEDEGTASDGGTADAGEPGGRGGPGGSGDGEGDGEGAGPPSRVVPWSAVRVKQQVLPEYPEAARVLDLGDVSCTVRIQIDEKGHPRTVTPLRCPGPFQESAVAAAMKWRFYPVKEGGEGVPAMFDLSIRYVLR